MWLIGFVNAFNFMDGVNGISAAHALIGGAAYAALGWWRPDAFLAAAVPGPAGFAFLSQEIEPDDYRGRAVTFRGDLRTTDVADRAGLVLRIPRHGRRPAPPDPWHDPENHFATVTGTRDWTRHEVTAQVPADAISIIFGVFLNGRGQIELRNPELEPRQAGQRS